MADPLVIGEGHHELFAGCSYKSGVLNYKRIDFDLRSKPGNREIAARNSYLHNSPEHYYYYDYVYHVHIYK